MMWSYDSFCQTVEVPKRRDLRNRFKRRDAASTLFIAFGRKAFPGVEDIGQFPSFVRKDDRMHMVCRDNMRAEFIARIGEVK